jgi:hypothetical protein
MFKIRVTEKTGMVSEYTGTIELVTRLTEMGHGLPERPELDEMGQPTGVILPAEYTIEIEDITAQVAQEAINAEALAYLAATDWLIIREVDAGVPCPADIKVLRAEARAKIVR